jgi:ribonuclease PH
MEKLGERTIYLDCDVLQADGGTRTASITGGFVALALACKKLKDSNFILNFPLRNYVAAVSCGIVKGEALLDLCYEEDSAAEVDMNFVLTGGGDFVEVQGTAESKPFSQEQMNKMIELARVGHEALFAKQEELIGAFFKHKR